MLHIDLPCVSEISQLANENSDACVSIYVKTSPLREELHASKVELSNLAKTAYQKLEGIKLDKRRLALISEQIDELLEDDSFWRLHSSSLAVFVTPEKIITYRLPNDLTSRVEVSNRFYIKPLLRSLTFSHSADVLVLTENSVRLIEFFENGQSVEEHIAELPSKGMHALLANPDGMGQVAMHKENARLVQYVRYINQVLRPYYLQNNQPLILVATDHIAALFKKHCTLPNLIQKHVNLSADNTSVADIVTLARPILAEHHKAQLDSALALVTERQNQNRTAFDLTDVARKVTYGAVDTLLIDIDACVPGLICEEGKVTLFDKSSAEKGDVIDEITKRALETGAKIVAVRANELPAGASNVVAVLRYAL
ncbi:hypothetical protein [Thorsellia anophelis]|uniref:Uncharacterized protein n=1 Tax=Thorsellia anophelis DSM 18579 TaxID=1123402 RepID=A0A1I0E6V5_9GAMM|nr:hypothetical protein [Thorsellia anophelis]SET40682.1 hypothetical protein SAMN02583745_02271 [Thorsellia anophelis DSM 18579]